MNTGKACFSRRQKCRVAVSHSVRVSADTVHLYVGSAWVPHQSYQGDACGRWAPEKGPHSAHPKQAFTIALGSRREPGGTVRCADRQR